MPVDPEPSTTSTSHTLPILVNIGDLLSYWTGGLLRSTVHRVVFPAPTTKEAQTERYSIAYFCHPLDDAVLEEVPSEIVKAHKMSGKAVEFEGMEDLGEGKIMTAKEHLMSRLAVRYSENRTSLVRQTDDSTGNLWWSYVMSTTLLPRHFLLKRYCKALYPPLPCLPPLTHTRTCPQRLQ